MQGRRGILLGAAGLLLGGCFESSCYESNPQQKKFVADLAAIAKPAMASNNPLAIEEAVKRTLALSEAVGAFADWCGTLRRDRRDPRFAAGRRRRACR